MVAQACLATMLGGIACAKPLRCILWELVAWQRLSTISSGDEVLWQPQRAFAIALPSHNLSADARTATT